MLMQVAEGREQDHSPACVGSLPWSFACKRLQPLALSWTASMPNPDILRTTLDARLSAELINRWQRPCRPRLLVLVDGLNYLPTDGFGLSRFVEAISQAPGVSTRPIVTLAHRAAHASPVTIGSESYTVLSNFNFATAATPVTLANYDQIWIFGIGPGPFALSNPEVAVIASFMNGGGGVFATGDHAALGRALCGSLPRIRHMREWQNVPMGGEADAGVAVNRIDTVVNPGANGLYEFVDQSDAIPQRIYPNYRVTDTDGLAGSAWQATLHPLLRLPGAPAIRSSSDPGGPASGFSLDMDVLPDHPHESVCYDVTSAAVLGGTYTIGGQNFPEFQPNSANQRVGAEIVAFAVSGGRAVQETWKPPVRPRMFGVISAYDGRLAQPYQGQNQRPGRIVCDSTWHHFVNINLDGTGTGRTGLGSGSGASFTPSADLEKIYTYYRNIVAWLQPANRAWCSLFWDLTAVRVHPSLFEELLDRERLSGWSQQVGLGRQAQQLLTLAYGPAATKDLLIGALQAEASTAPIGDLIANGGMAGSSVDAEVLLEGIVGGLLLQMGRILPDDLDPKRMQEALEKGPLPHLPALQGQLRQSLNLGVAQQTERVERGLKLLRSLKLPALV